MRVDWAILCRYCEVNGGLATIVGAGVDNFWLPTLPGLVTATVAVRFASLEHEIGPGKPHTAVAVVFDPAMEEISRLEFQLLLSQNPLHNPGWEGGFIATTVHQFMASSAGAYSIDFAVDGQSGRTVPLMVNEGAPPGG